MREGENYSSTNVARPSTNVAPPVLALPAPEDKQFKTSFFPGTPLSGCSSLNPIPKLLYNNCLVSRIFLDNCDLVIKYPPSPIIEEPPPHGALQILDADIEDTFYEYDEIPTIKLALEQFGHNFQNFMQENEMKIPDDDISKAIVKCRSCLYPSSQVKEYKWPSH